MGLFSTELHLKKRIKRFPEVHSHFFSLLVHFISPQFDILKHSERIKLIYSINAECSTLKSTELFLLEIPV